jgi:hypothetical protein
VSDESVASLVVATEHQTRTRAVRAAQTAAIIAAWRSLDPARPIASWIEGVGERIYVLLSTGQEAVAGMASDYVLDVLAVQDLATQMPTLNPANFAGIASDGRSLETLLAGAAIRVSLRQRQGASPAQAMQAGEAWLRMVVDTQINDASRAADSLAVAAVDAYEKTDQEKAAERAQRALRPLTPPASSQAVRSAPAVTEGTSVTTAERRAELERQRDALLARVARQADRQVRRPVSDEQRREQVERIKAETLARIERSRAERRAASARPERTVNRGAVSRRAVTVGYIRLLTPPSCARCAILAGRFYKWSDGFQRHPMCDCKHVPATQEVADPLLTDPQAYFESLSPEQQDYYFGKAGAEAIRSGADISRVVNAQDGMYVADDGRRYTRTGSKTRRGRRGSAPVLRPTVWQIYKDARGDRERAKRALEFNGYIVTR